MITVGRSNEQLENAVPRGKASNRICCADPGEQSIDSDFGDAVLHRRVSPQGRPTTAWKEGYGRF